MTSSVRRYAASTIALASLVSLIAGAGVATALLEPGGRAIPDDETEAGAQLPASVAEFDDSRSVALSLVTSSATSLVVRATGTVSSLECDETLRSGARPLSVDGSPVIALATAEPLWRDIPIGATGADVESLQSELVRLGADMIVDGYAGRVTMRAFSAAIGEDARVAESRTSIGLAETMWLPAPVTEIDDCMLDLAQPIADGAVYATTAQRLVAVSFTLPQGLDAGERTVLFDGLTAAVPEAEGVVEITDAAFVDAVSRSAASESASSGQEVTIFADLVLSEPQSVLAVPSRALGEISADRACIHFDGVAYATSIVASQLGTVMVALDEPPAELPTVVDVWSEDEHGDCDP